MSQLVRLTLTLFGLFTIAIILAITDGSRGSSAMTTLRDAILTNPDGSQCQQPCFFGVRPGQMTVDNGRAILVTHPFIVNILQLHIGNTSSDNFSMDDGRNTFIDIGALNFTVPLNYGEYSTDNTDFTLGQVLANFGTPRSVIFQEFGDPPRYDVLLIYPEQGLNALLIYNISSTLQPNDHLAYVDVRASDDPIYTGACNPPVCQRWQGFKSIGAYLTGFPPSP